MDNKRLEPVTGQERNVSLEMEYGISGKAHMENEKGIGCIMSPLVRMGHEAGWAMRT